MISGLVYLTGHARIPTGEPRVTIHVADISGETHPVEFLVDTGFDGDLTLSPALIRRLGLPHLRVGKVTLADNLDREFGVYGAEVSWNGKTVEVEVLESEDDPPLLGMAMLWGSRITIEAREGGLVTIEDLEVI